MGHTEPGSRAPERRGLSGVVLFYGHVISFIVAQIHDTKGLVCEINIHFSITPATLLSYAKLAAKTINRGRWDKTALPLRLISRLAGMLVFSWYSESIWIEYIRTQGSGEKDLMKEGNNLQRA